MFILSGPVVEPARQAFAAVLTGGRGMIFSGRYSNEISRLGLIARVGTVILPEKNCDKGNFLSVNNQIGRGVFAVMSVDGKPLTESGRLLLLHLTYSLANKMKFSNAKATRLETWGELPFLAARGEAEIELATPPGTEYKLFTVNTAGERLEELPVARNTAGITFPVKVFTAKGSVFAYELLRQ